MPALMRYLRSCFLKSVSYQKKDERGHLSFGMTTTQDITDFFSHILVSRDEILMQRMVNVSDGRVDVDFLNSMVSEQELAVQSILPEDAQVQGDANVKSERAQRGTNVAFRNQTTVDGKGKSEITINVKINNDGSIHGTSDQEATGTGEGGLTCKGCKLDFSSATLYLNHSCVQYEPTVQTKM